MAAQNASLSFASTRSPASGHPRRARTKHACDECRRSQKRCDGQKPFCGRCEAGGTSCSYTPHKARNQCASGLTDQGAKDGHYEPQVFEDIYLTQESDSESLDYEASQSSVSSREQSPVEGEIFTPSPTAGSHDEKTGYASQESNAYLTPFESAQQFVPAQFQQLHDTQLMPVGNAQFPPEPFDQNLTRESSGIPSPLSPSKPLSGDLSATAPVNKLDNPTGF